MLSFELVENGSTIQIHCDWAGLTRFKQKLEELTELGGHIHIRSPSAGGKDLMDTTPFGKAAIPEVIITTGGDDWPE